jgi:hypothetical protein
MGNPNKTKAPAENQAIKWGSVLYIHIKRKKEKERRSVSIIEYIKVSIYK